MFLCEWRGAAFSWKHTVLKTNKEIETSQMFCLMCNLEFFSSYLKICDSQFFEPIAYNFISYLHMCVSVCVLDFDVVAMTIAEGTCETTNKWEKTAGGVRQKKNNQEKTVCGNLWTLISHVCARWRCALCYYIIKTVNHIFMDTLAVTAGQTFKQSKTTCHQSQPVNQIIESRTDTKTLSSDRVHYHRHKHELSMSLHTTVVSSVHDTVWETVWHTDNSKNHHSNHTATTPKHVCVMTETQQTQHWNADDDTNTRIQLKSHKSFWDAAPSKLM